MKLNKRKELKCIKCGRLMALVKKADGRWCWKCSECKRESIVWKNLL